MHKPQTISLTSAALGTLIAVLVTLMIGSIGQSIPVVTE